MKAPALPRWHPGHVCVCIITYKTLHAPQCTCLGPQGEEGFVAMALFGSCRPCYPRFISPYSLCGLPRARQEIRSHWNGASNYQGGTQSSTSGPLLSQRRTSTMSSAGGRWQSWQRGSPVPNCSSLLLVLLSASFCDFLASASQILRWE